MKDSYCPQCPEKHSLYYLLKADDTEALFLLCPNDEPGKVATIFVPFIKGLPIETYTSGSVEYANLKGEALLAGIFSEDESWLINQWRKAKFAASQMTMPQRSVIRRYITGDIKW